MAKAGKSEGVPKETVKNSSLAQLQHELARAISAAAAKKFITELVDKGYFDLALLDQKRAVVEKLASLPQRAKVMDVLLQSESDKICAYAVSLSAHVFAASPVKQLALLKKAGALPGTWTQETAQTELKNLMNREGLESILPRIKNWASDAKPEVRRMLIEALRPRGVWCKHLEVLKRDPSPIKPLLEQLLDDPSLYVRKAVANNLNDIAKDNPTTLCKWVKQWRRGKISAERKWIIKRGLCSLLRDGVPEALALSGYGDAAALEVKWENSTPKRLKIGDEIPFKFTVTNHGKGATKCRLQLDLHAPGKGNKPRISRYLLADFELAGNESKAVTKQVKYDHKNSVPRLPGEHKLAVSLNGWQVGKRKLDMDL